MTTHASLFSGIGGFDLAAQWCGWRNVFQVEIDRYCRAVLAKNFPDTAQYEDIKKFDGKEYRGCIDIISGGFPCQPFSVAGQRKGTADNRALWPEMLRVISEIKPAWVVAENVVGLASMVKLGRKVSVDSQTSAFGKNRKWIRKSKGYLESICQDLETLGYEVVPVVISAAAVGAPHVRERLFIIAHDNSSRWGGKFYRIAQWTLPEQEERREGFQCEPAICDGLNTTNTDGSRQLQPQGIIPEIGERTGNGTGYAANADWRGRKKQRQPGQSHPQKIPRTCNGDGVGFGDGRPWWEVAAGIRGMVHGVSAGLDGIRELSTRSAAPHKNRKKAQKKGTAQRITALGNAVVPAVAYEIFRAIQEQI